MDYSALALNATWTQNSVSFATNEEAYKYFLYMREVIMDSKLYVNKVIGFDLSMTDIVHGNGEQNITGIPDLESGTSSQPRISRHPNMCDSNIELCNIFKHYLFLDPKVYTYRVKIHPGVNTLDENPFKTINGEPVEMLSINKKICKCLGITNMPFYLTLHTEYGIGYKSMADVKLPSVDEMSHSIKCFPLNIDFNIMEYVKIIPKHVDNKVYYRLENGMTPEILGEIFTQHISKVSEL